MLEASLVELERKVGRPFLHTLSTRVEAPTLAPAVVRWTQSLLVHGEGDLYGSPFRWRQWQLPFLWSWFERGSRWRYRRALLLCPKGVGKTEMGAALGLAEAFGPAGPMALGRGPANVPVAAASFEQANLLFGRASQMAGHDLSGLKPFVETFDTEILSKSDPTRLYRVAAAAGTNDGSLPTLFLADEIHEWTGQKERVHLVIGNSLAKRSDGRELNMSTPGASDDSLLGRMWDYGAKVAQGEIDDPEFLLLWYSAPESLDLDVDEERDLAIRLANPHADVELVENLHRRWREVPEHEFRRYHLAQWVQADGTWMPQDGRWDACRESGGLVAPPDGSRVALGFDGSYGGDSTALVGCTVDGGVPHLWTLGVWERPDGTAQWQVPRESVEARVAEAMRRWRVVELACDPFWWEREIDEWERSYPVERYPTNVDARMAPACSKLFSAVAEGTVSHDGDPSLGRHVGNCRPKDTRHGTVVVKDRKGSPHKIDLAVAAVIAFDRATWYARQDGGTVNLW